MREIASLIPALIVFSLLAYPIGRIYRRLGHSPWWALACFVPLGFVVLLWWLALKAQPADDARQGEQIC